MTYVTPAQQLPGENNPCFQRKAASSPVTRTIFDDAFKALDRMKTGKLRLPRLEAEELHCADQVLAIGSRPLQASHFKKLSAATYSTRYSNRSAPAPSERFAPSAAA